MKVSNKSIDDTHCPRIREALMDSGASILNLSTSRKVLSLLRSITGLYLCEAWGLETGDCKTREILHFPPFLLHSLTVETGRKRPELVLCE